MCGKHKYSIIFISAPLMVWMNEYHSFYFFHPIFSLFLCWYVAVIIIASPGFLSFSSFFTSSPSFTGPSSSDFSFLVFLWTDVCPKAAHVHAEFVCTLTIKATFTVYFVCLCPRHMLRMFCSVYRCTFLRQLCAPTFSFMSVAVEVWLYWGLLQRQKNH